MIFGPGRPAFLATLHHSLPVLTGYFRTVVCASGICPYILRKISPLRDLLAYDLLNPAGQQLLTIGLIRLIVRIDFRLVEIVFALQSLFSLSPEQAILG